MNYRWLDPLGRGYVGNHIGAAWWIRYGAMLCSAQIWEIFTEVENCGRECKILLVEFNSSEKIACSSIVQGKRSDVAEDRGTVGRPTMHRVCTKKKESYLSIALSTAQEELVSNSRDRLPDRPTRTSKLALHRARATTCWVWAVSFLAFWIFLWSDFRSVGFFFFNDSLTI